MEQYKYSVITDKGEKQQGRLWAENKEEARIKLRHSYQYVVALQEEREAYKKKILEGKGHGRVLLPLISLSGSRYSHSSRVYLTYQKTTSTNTLLTNE